MSQHATQGRTLIAALRKRPHTYLDMLAHCVSTSPWKRIAETLRPTEKLVKGTRRVGDRYLTTWRVVSG